MWSENSAEIQSSYTKPLVLETYLTPHSSLLTPLQLEQVELVKVVIYY